MSERYEESLVTWAHEDGVRYDNVEISVSESGTILLTAETYDDANNVERIIVIVHPDKVTGLIAMLQCAREAYKGSFLDWARDKTALGDYVPTPAPSFKAQFGRAPVAGQDYDPDGPMCQDDYEYLAGEGQYSDNANPGPADTLTWEEQRAIHDYELDIVRDVTDPRW